ncbi:MAG: hypothetical protein NTZ09_05545 [Candidatus Hydrogenedentes bacterium]|nr:hypothetical protein [Candidatus Hydrogenedentota bacterium]
MTKKRIILIVLAVLLAGVVGVLLVMDSRFKVLFSSPRVSHETVVSPETTRGVLVIDVPQAKSLIQRKFNAPGWALPMALPYEAAVVVDVDRFLGDVNIKVFINDKRLAPVIREFAKNLKLPVPFDSWFKEPMRQERRGVLLLEGMTVCGREIRSVIEKQWKDAAIDAPLQIEGGHLLEGVLDNRDGAALALASVLADVQNINLTEGLDETSLGFLAAISDYRLQADLVSDNELAVRVLIECAPSADPSIVGMLQALIEMGLMSEQVKQNAERLGCSYTGSTTVEGNTVVADYKVNIERLLARL